MGAAYQCDSCKQTYPSFSNAALYANPKLNFELVAYHKYSAINYHMSSPPKPFELCHLCFKKFLEKVEEIEQMF